jgi:LPXTG-motif cell wall-anchored protein
MDLLKSLFNKGMFYVLIAVGLYCVGYSLDAVPQPVKDVLGWADANTVALVFGLCFLVGSYVVLKRRRNSEE